VQEERRDTYKRHLDEGYCPADESVVFAVATVFHTLSQPSSDTHSNYNGYSIHFSTSYFLFFIWNQSIKLQTFGIYDI